MRLLHTADWHLGQTLHDFDRTGEHRAFLDWLAVTLEAEAVDALDALQSLGRKVGVISHVPEMSERIAT